MTNSDRDDRKEKLANCFVDFRKAFDTVPRAMLWQVLEGLGLCGRILDIIKYLFAREKRSRTAITRHICHLQMPHGGEARVSIKSNAVWDVC